jgi:hypothetical protein
MPPHWANAHVGLAVRPRVGEATPPHPYKPLGLLAGPPLSSREGSALGKTLGFWLQLDLLAGRRIFNCLQTSTSFPLAYQIFTKKSIDKCYSLKGLLPIKDLSVFLWSVEVSTLLCKS